MTIEDGHFRTDGETIEPCCESQKWMIDNTLYFRLMYSTTSASFITDSEMIT